MKLFLYGKIIVTITNLSLRFLFLTIINLLAKDERHENLHMVALKCLEGITKSIRNLYKVHILK